MNRCVLTDGSGRWFDVDEAISFEEATWFDGSNNVSVVCEDKHDHETLYRTAHGAWVLEHRSQWQGRSTTYEQITEAAALRWLSICGYDDADGLEALEI